MARDNLTHFGLLGIIFIDHHACYTNIATELAEIFHC